MRFSRYAAYGYNTVGPPLTRNADVATELKVHHCSEDKAIEYPQAKVTRVSRHEVLENSCSLIRNFATWVDG